MTALDQDEVNLVIRKVLGVVNEASKSSKAVSEKKKQDEIEKILENAFAQLGKD